jgi:hypothetical protein
MSRHILLFKRMHLVSYLRFYRSPRRVAGARKKSMEGGEWIGCLCGMRAWEMVSFPWEMVSGSSPSPKL